MGTQTPKDELKYSLLSTETIEKLRKQLPRGPLTEAFDKVMEERRKQKEENEKLS